MGLSMDAERLVQIAEWIVAGCDLGASDLADRSAYSRSHYSRTFARLSRETLRGFRRRLLLERAAFLLGNARSQVGEIAVESGFESHAGFTRAFRRAYGIAPEDYRKSDAYAHWLPTPNGVHFHPAGLLVHRQGTKQMTITDRLIGHHFDSLYEMLNLSERLTSDQLDQASILIPSVLSFDEPHRSIRQTFDSMIFTLEIWLAAFRGRTFERAADLSLEGMRVRLAKASDEFTAFVAEIDANGLQDSEFVDALCEPPETFTFGGTIAHILTFSIQRRLLVLTALKSFGIDEMGSDDPIMWERKAPNA